MAHDRRGIGEEIDGLIGVGGGEARSEPFSGTKALMLAVLEDALRTYLNGEPRAREEAASWLFGPHPRSVFSFVVVCETLGVDPSAARAALRRMADRDTGSVLLPRSRPNASGSAGLSTASASWRDE